MIQLRIADLQNADLTTEVTEKMESEESIVARAIERIRERHLFKKDGRTFVVQSLIPVSEWRPLDEPWWRKKEASVIGKDPDGNLYLAMCDGTIRFWDHKKQADEILSPSVRQFFWDLCSQRE